MSFSVLSFLNAVFWFNLGLIPIAILQARWKIAMKYSPALLAALAILAGVRVFFPLDSPMFLVIRSHVVLRFLQQVLVYKLFDAVPTWVFAVAVWIVGGSTVLLREFYVCKTGGPGKAGSTYITIRLSAQPPRWEFRCG